MSRVYQTLSILRLIRFENVFHCTYAVHENEKLKKLSTILQRIAVSNYA